ncbi:hypothetical protein ACFV4P_13720 [Kitasatospora sp. NPDC059795]|uniref:hypothetical protein n=1 Tax=Kitasatospora sp. NPDC059795 TaxID=3346949 RepID=UPI00365460AB
MRAPTQHHHGTPLRGTPLRGAAAVALALATAAALTLGGSASADDPSNAQLLIDSGFAGPLGLNWQCTNVARDGAGITGHPVGDDYARCSQTVAVLEHTTYKLEASISGPYVFLGAVGGDTPDTYTWANYPSSGRLSTTVTTGPTTTRLTVYVHGWYGQEAYHASSVTLTGPRAPVPCGSFTMPPPPSPSRPATTPPPPSPSSAAAAANAVTPTASCLTPYPLERAD